MPNEELIAAVDEYVWPAHVDPNEWISSCQGHRLNTNGGFGGPCRTALYKWMTIGKIARDGTLVPLPHRKRGNRLVFTMASYDWWEQRLDR